MSMVKPIVQSIIRNPVSLPGYNQFLINPIPSGAGLTMENIHPNGFKFNLQSGTGLAYWDGIWSGVLNDVVEVRFNIQITSGSPSLSLRPTGNGQVRSNLVTISTSGWQTATLTATGVFNNLVISEGDNPSVWELQAMEYKYTPA